MLTYNPSLRISASEAFQHPWIQSQNEVEINPAVLINLAKFKEANKLHIATKMFIVTHMISKSEQKELEKTFKALDTNGDGHLSKEELEEGYTKLYNDPEKAKSEAKLVMLKADSNSSGQIDYSGI